MTSSHATFTDDYFFLEDKVVPVPELLTCLCFLTNRFMVNLTEYLRYSILILKHILCVFYQSQYHNSAFTCLTYILYIVTCAQTEMVITRLMEIVCILHVEIGNLRANV